MLGRDVCRSGPGPVDPAACCGTSPWASHPWDQQWSLRMQQVLAFEPMFSSTATSSTDRGRRGAHHRARDAAQTELDDVLGLGGHSRRSTCLVSAGHVDGRAHTTHRVRRAYRCRCERLRRDCGVPVGRHRAHPQVDPTVEAESVAALATWRAELTMSPSKLLSASCVGGGVSDNVMPASIALARQEVPRASGVLDARGFRRVPRPTGVGSALAGRGELAAVAEFVRTIPWAHRSCSSQNRASTATRTAPNRSLSPRATPDGGRSTRIRLPPGRSRIRARRGSRVIGISILSVHTSTGSRV